MFHIDLVDQEDKVIDSVSYRKFKIKIGDFEEYFLSPLCYWSVEDYQLHWGKMLHDFMKGNKESAFLITEMYDPAKANFIRWWVLYRKGDNVSFQEKILFMAGVEKFSVESAASLIPKHQLINDDGNEISEWVLPIDQFKLSPLLN